MIKFEKGPNKKKVSSINTYVRALGLLVLASRNRDFPDYPTFFSHLSRRKTKRKYLKGLK